MAKLSISVSPRPACRPSAAPMLSSRRRRYRANIRCGGGSLRPKSLPTLEELGIGFVAFSPLGKGFLTGAISEKHRVRQRRIPQHRSPLHAVGQRGYRRFARCGDFSRGCRCLQATPTRLSTCVRPPRGECRQRRVRVFQRLGCLRRLRFWDAGGMVQPSGKAARPARP
jgi:hypothetical protein